LVDGKGMEKMKMRGEELKMQVEGVRTG